MPAAAAQRELPLHTASRTRAPSCNADNGMAAWRERGLAALVLSYAAVQLLYGSVRAPRRKLRQQQHQRRQQHHQQLQRLQHSAATAAAWADGCNQLPHTELGGSVVRWGAHFKVSNATACCDGCKAHNTQGHRHNCTSWVYNHDLQHAQHGECWLKRHPNPWSDMALLQGVARSWHSGVVGVPRPSASLTTRSCRGPLEPEGGGATLAAVGYAHAQSRAARAEERSLCPPVAAAEASFELRTPLGSVRLRLNRRGAPRAAAWIEALLDSGVCTGVANKSRCAPYCCQFYRAEAAVGINRLNASVLRRYGLDPARPPHWGRDFFWGPPYGFVQGRLWHAPGAPKGPTLPAERSLRKRPTSWQGAPPPASRSGRCRGLPASGPRARAHWPGDPPSRWARLERLQCRREARATRAGSEAQEAQQAVLHRGTVELVGEGPDFLIALGDHPLMPPHNAFAHVVEEDLPVLDAMVETQRVRIEPWWPNSSILEAALGFELRRVP